MGNRSEGKTYVLHHPFVFFEVCKSREHISSFCSQPILAFYGNYSVYARCIALVFLPLSAFYALCLTFFSFHLNLALPWILNNIPTVFSLLMQEAKQKVASCANLFSMNSFVSFHRSISLCRCLRRRRWWVSMFCILKFDCFRRQIYGSKLGARSGTSNEREQYANKLTVLQIFPFDVECKMNRTKSVLKNERCTIKKNWTANDRASESIQR